MMTPLQLLLQIQIQMTFSLLFDSMSSIISHEDRLWETNALGGLPNNKLFFILPEMTSAKYLHNSILSYHMLISIPARPIEREKCGWCVCAAYLEDGHIISAQ